MRTGTIEDSLFETLGGKVLRPAVVDAILDGVFTEMAPKNLTRSADRLRAELQDTERAMMNLTKAIAAGGQLEPLLEAPGAAADAA
jgi:hypothetical protein